MYLLLVALLLSTSVWGQTAETYRQRAIEFSRQQSWDEAIANYRQALTLAPKDALTHYDLALALKYKGDARQAAEEFQAALKLKPKWGDAYFGLAAAHYALHDAASALKELRTAV